ncbi:MAG TPA: phosphatase PAP2 family protein [Burkholderiales bacterium]|nr:phosphatase PAP2 family protein [Burkholderiales bacterium]
MGRNLLCLAQLLLCVPAVHAGIDHPVPIDNSGIWARSNQNLLRYGALIGDIALAVWEGGETRLGKSAWQSIDSVALAGVTAEAGKRIFGRLRPSETSDPHQWFQGGRSFPSGEVAEISSIVTPYVLEYGHDHPAVYALELLPLYDAIARVKVGAHWQTDVLAGWALGTATGYLAQRRESPFILGVLPHGFSVGLKKQF